MKSLILTAGTHGPCRSESADSRHNNYITIVEWYVTAMATSGQDGPDGRGSGIRFVHWWQDGDGGAGLNALLEGFRGRKPNESVVPEQESNLSMQVKSDILREEPPDVWVEWPGASMRPYRESRALADVSSVWKESGLEANCRSGPERAARDGDAYYTVPLNIHRSNVLFYRPRHLEDAGIDPGSIGDPEGFLTVLEQLGDGEGAPLILPLKNPWVALQLWETVLLGKTNAETLESILHGEAESHENVIRESLALLDAYTEYAPDDSLFTGLPGASSQFLDGAGTFYPQGDWVAAEFTDATGFDLGEEWECVPFPGTGDAYVVVMDGLMVSPSALADDGVRQFARYAASRDGQRAFNVHKESLPPRSDIEMDAFSPFLQRQHDDLERVRDQPLSLTHGLAVAPDRRIEATAAMATFLSTSDVEESTRQLVAALG
jgi:glucose/mannose transport system substrate-binding protein